LSFKYLNPGIIQQLLFKEAYEGMDKKYSHVNNYFIPYEYNDYLTLYEDKTLENWHVRFDVYSNLLNTSYGELGKFFKIASKNHKLELAINRFNNLVILIDDIELYKEKYEYDKIYSFEIHIYSKPKIREEINIYINHQLIFTNSHLLKYFNAEKIESCYIKNIIYIENEELLHHALAFSNIIISESYIGKQNVEIAEIETSSENKDLNINETYKFKPLINKHVSAIQINLHNDISNEVMEFAYKNYKELHILNKTFSNIYENNPNNNFLWKQTDFLDPFIITHKGVD